MPSVLGIDPGKNGAAVFITADHSVDSWIRFGNTSWTDFDKFLSRLSRTPTSKATIEKVNGRPGDTPLTAFQFGRSVGAMEAILLLHGLGHETVQPQVWQREFGLGNIASYGDRQRAYQASAQAYFPHIKVTQDLGAAILIAEYAWRKVNGQLRETPIHDGGKRGDGVVGKSSVRRR